MTKKLIEVALPLEAINRESAREKSIRHGHPSTLHLWWARRPLAACRAVLFASLVDDPSAHSEQFPTEEAQEQERQRLFRIIEELVKWENSTNEAVLEAARAEILRSTGGNPPPVLDPFCGGGSIPLEAQRLGLEAHASDLNPVAVLITKALIEIPPKFAGQPPVNPEDRRKGMGVAWKGAAGLAADVRYYGRWMRDEAERRIGILYPKAKLPDGTEATVIAWLWARTVVCPNPACGARMPLVRSFWLSTKAGKKAWVEPLTDHNTKTVRFEVKTGNGVPPEGTVNRRGAKCLVCGTVASLDHIRSEAQAGKMSKQCLATVVEVARSRSYIAPVDGHEAIASSATPQWKPTEEVTRPSHDVDRLPMYGMYAWGDAFTSRQLVVLTTLCDLMREARERVYQDISVTSNPNEDASHTSAGSQAYADAVAMYLGLAIDKMADYNSSLVVWSQTRDQAKSTFARQALPMVWDFAEVNPFARAAGDLEVSIAGMTEALERGLAARGRGEAVQSDATSKLVGKVPTLVSTDPPYYDNIGYSDLSDFFYVWLRRSLGASFPSLFGTVLTPKSTELVASPHRFNGSKPKAERFFEEGLTRAFSNIHAVSHAEYPLTVYYAFKQAESDDNDADGSISASAAVASTGWETMLEALLSSRLAVNGTWPVRTERGARMNDIGSNALASSIVLVCRPRPADAPTTDLRGFQRALKRELPDALRKLQHGNIAPVDLAQAAIGPGMAVFSRYAQVNEPDGSPMRVRRALQLINQALDEVLAEQESEYDADTRWAVAWFEQFGMNEGRYGDAETLSKAKNSSVEGMKHAGIVASGAGKVRLLRRDELPADWDPATDTRTPVWELTQQIIRALDQGGEQAAAALIAKAPTTAEIARDLAYRLYTTCERKGWAQEALAYNSLVVAWPQIKEQAAAIPAAPEQGRLV